MQVTDHYVGKNLTNKKYTVENYIPKGYYINFSMK